MTFKSLLSAVPLSLLIATAAVAAEAKVRITVPDDTIVSVQLIEPVTSGENHIGDLVDFKTVDTVSAGGYVIIASNAKGRGRVVKVDPAGGHGHAGTVEIVVDYVFAVDGFKIKIKDTPFRQEGQKARGGATVAGIFTYGLASNAVRGGEASFNTTRTLAVHVDGTVHVSSTI